jgi:hypothetical protein
MALKLLARHCTGAIISVRRKCLAGGTAGHALSATLRRAVDFAPQDGGELLPLKKCGRWKKMQQIALEWTEDDEPPDHWPCWPCWKLDKLSQDCADWTDILGTCIVLF